jgi:hypothetical protein
MSSEFQLKSLPSAALGATAGASFPRGETRPAGTSSEVAIAADADAIARTARGVEK